MMGYKWKCGCEVDDSYHLQICSDTHYNLLIEELNKVEEEDESSEANP
jgi:hypothetical protein